MSTPTALRFTYQDYLLLPEERRYEIIDGELFMTPAPGLAHQRLIGRLFRFLDEYVRRSQLGEVLISPCDVVLSETDVVQPDLLFVATERLGIIGEKSVSAAPDLVVEVLSASTQGRDRGIKAKLYARFGTRELWFADPETKRVEVHVNSGEGFQQVSVFTSRDHLKSPLLDGLEIPIDELF